MEVSPVARIDRKSSIESEPRTLNFDQIDYAREAALYVMNTTRNIEEAMSIFMEGLEPVTSESKGNGSDERMMEAVEEEGDCYLEAVHDDIHKDVASAPF